MFAIRAFDQPQMPTGRLSMPDIRRRCNRIQLVLLKLQLLRASTTKIPVISKARFDCEVYGLLLYHLHRGGVERAQRSGGRASEGMFESLI